jgi:cytochrome c-type biogenesis protein CcmH
VGATRDGGPQTQQERIVSLEKRLACPVCQGESVFASRNSASEQIRESIRQGVEQESLTDQEIIDRIVSAYNGEELLVPTASGIEALAWALPATAFVIGVTGLALAFRRWQGASRRLGTASDDDYALVGAALERHDDEP